MMRELKEFYVDKAFMLLYRAYRWHTKSELHHWSIKKLKKVIEELERKEDKK